MSFEPATVEQHIENWRAGLRRDSERLGVDKHTTDLIIETIEPSVRAQIEWLNVIEMSVPNIAEPRDMESFFNTMLEEPYRSPQ
ncbi:hypothetical protein PQR39_35550 [Paraburkholderia sediminicola]|uniref:hypothetical protein n=1 Tax=Paraburkholderia sediminicola TaxID=458836 RepID=UPI0038BCD9F5